MVYSYQELLKIKEQKGKLNWEEMTREQLKNLFVMERISNQMIADLYDVSYDKVRRQREKWDLKKYNAEYMTARYTEENSLLFEMLNTDSKNRLLQSKNIDWISKALTHHIFRNGPIEDMHANGQLSQEDMKILNKYMVNRIGGILNLLSKGEWLKVELILSFLEDYGYGKDWDPVEYDTEEIETVFEHFTGLESSLLKK